MPICWVAPPTGVRCAAVRDPGHLACRGLVHSQNATHQGDLMFNCTYIQIFKMKQMMDTPNTTGNFGEGVTERTVPCFRILALE